MKKTILLMAISVLLSTAATAGYIRTTSGGGPDGYDKTKKTTEGQNTTISCSDPGYESCPTVADPGNQGGIGVNDQQICFDIAFGNIVQGTLSGSQIVSIAGSGIFKVLWSSHDIEGRTSTITIEEL